MKNGTIVSHNDGERIIFMKTRKSGSSNIKLISDEQSQRTGQGLS